ncbi:MAG TPA: threonylcarbamoyl-AMP synthase [Bacteroidetes bacterium]|nr:threonylcarbamoyl-AMP synthase [Candidatus Limimorpha avicola]
MNNVEFEQEVNRCVDYLKQGKVILYPTDTIWGLGCDATNSKAVERLFRIKNRPLGKGLIILVDSIERISDYVVNMPAVARDLIAAAHNPLSIIYSESKGLAKNISADGTVCVRVTSNELCKEVIKKFGRPITSTSANISGDPSPMYYGEISDNVKQLVDYEVLLFHDVLTKPKPSTIIRLFEDNTFKVIRS